MGATTIQTDDTFDSGVVSVSTSATWQTVCELLSHGRRVLASVILGGGQTIGDFRILQAAYQGDPNPQVVADGTGFNSPALADQSYIIPALAFPLPANSVFQVHLQGDAAALIFQAQTAGGTGATVQVKGMAAGLKI